MRGLGSGALGEVAVMWPDPEDVRRVAIVRLSSLGDVVLSEPVVRAIAARYPSAQVAFVTRAPYHALYKGHPRVHAVTTLEAAQGAHFDLVVDLHARWDTRRWAWGARHRVTWQKRDILDAVGAALRRPMRPRAGESDAQTARMLADLDLPVPDGGLGARVTHLSGAVFANQGVLLPGGQWATKRWPLGRWTDLADAFRAQGHSVIAMGGPGDEAVLAALSAAGVPILPSTLSIAEAATHLAGAQWVVGNDSGLTHLAAALGRPTVVVFGPTRVSRWAPLGTHVRTVSRGLACAPCSDYGQRACSLATRLCLDDLTVAQVVEAWATLTSMSGSPELIAERAE